MAMNTTGHAQTAEAGGFAPRTHITIVGDRWHINGQPAFPGSIAEGLLTNVRMVNSVFEDTGPAAQAHLPADFARSAPVDIEAQTSPAGGS